MLYQISTQALAILASIIFALSFHAKTRFGILVAQAVSMFIWAIHFSFLSAWTGASLVITNVFVTCLFLGKQKYPWIQHPLILLLSLVFFAVFTILTWSGVSSIFAFMGVGMMTLAKWQEDQNSIRALAIPASLGWIVYDIFIGSFGGIVSESAFIISSLVSLLRKRSI